MEEFLRILSNCDIVDFGDDFYDAIECFEMGDNLAQLLPEIYQSVRKLTLEAHQALGCRGVTSDFGAVQGKGRDHDATCITARASILSHKL